MLEVKNLSKIYKTKGGDVKALDNVSVTFPEKGMIFLLGKSGSGKSTLLNICGGLDSPTSGEIIVKGKSSKNFIQSDFDSYRNTFIGFIFQEYKYKIILNINTRWIQYKYKCKIYKNINKNINTRHQRTEI